MNPPSSSPRHGPDLPPANSEPSKVRATIEGLGLGEQLVGQHQQRVGAKLA